MCCEVLWSVHTHSASRVDNFLRFSEVHLLVGVVTQNMLKAVGNKNFGIIIKNILYKISTFRF